MSSFIVPMAGPGWMDGNRPSTEHDQPQRGVLPIAEWTPATIAESVSLPCRAAQGGSWLIRFPTDHMYKSVEVAGAVCV